LLILQILMTKFYQFKITVAYLILRRCEKNVLTIKYSSCCKYWVMMIVDKYGNYVRKCMWQLCGGVELTFV
jgi:hypothetical protein